MASMPDPSRAASHAASARDVVHALADRRSVAAADVPGVTAVDAATAASDTVVRMDVLKSSVAVQLQEAETRVADDAMSVNGDSYSASPAVVDRPPAVSGVATIVLAPVRVPELEVTAGAGSDDSRDERRSQPKKERRLVSVIASENEARDQW